MANPISVRIGWSILGLASLALSGCGGSTDSSVPATNQSRDIAGVWRRYQIGIGGTRVSCPDPASLLAPSTRDLTVNNVVVDTCGASERLIFGTPSAPGRGRYHMDTLRGSEDGSYTITSTTLTLVRDTVNDTYLKDLSPSQPAQKTIYSLAFNSTDNTLRVSPIAQPVALKKRDTSLPAFREDGTLIASNVTPILNADQTVFTIILPGVNDVAVVNQDLTITVGPIASGASANDTPGFVRIRGVENTFQFTPTDPGTVIPTPKPAPSDAD